MHLLCGDDLESTIDCFSGSVPLGLCEGGVLEKAPFFVSIVLNHSLTDILSPLLCIEAKGCAKWAPKCCSSG